MGHLLVQTWAIAIPGVDEETQWDPLFALSCQQCQCHGRPPPDPILPSESFLPAWRQQLHHEFQNDPAKKSNNNLTSVHPKLNMLKEASDIGMQSTAAH